MDEQEYHEYISKQHAPLMKELLLRNKIIGYTMVGLHLNFNDKSLRADQHYITQVM